MLGINRMPRLDRLCLYLLGTYLSAVPTLEAQKERTTRNRNKNNFPGNSTAARMHWA